MKGLPYLSSSASSGAPEFSSISAAPSGGSLLGMCVLVTQSGLTLRPQWTVARQAPLSWGSPGRNTGVGFHFFLQGIFLTQGLNPRLSHCRQMLYRLSPLGSPLTLMDPEYFFSLFFLESSYILWTT